MTTSLLCTDVFDAAAHAAGVIVCSDCPKFAYLSVTANNAQKSPKVTFKDITSSLKDSGTLKLST